MRRTSTSSTRASPAPAPIHDSGSSTRYIRVRATTNARRSTIVCSGIDTWDVSVRERPQQGAANASIRELLAKELNVMPNRLRLVKGATKTSKLYVLL